MIYLPDTNICSAHMRRPGGLAHRFLQYSGQLAIPSIVLAELYAGAHRHPNPARLLGLIADLLQEVAVLDFDSTCAEQFGKVRGGLLQQGISVNSVDLMIASVALVPVGRRRITVGSAIAGPRAKHRRLAVKSALASRSAPILFTASCQFKTARLRRNRHRPGRPVLFRE